MRDAYPIDNRVPEEGAACGIVRFDSVGSLEGQDDDVSCRAGNEATLHAIGNESLVVTIRPSERRSRGSLEADRMKHATSVVPWRERGRMDYGADTRVARGSRKAPRVSPLRERPVSARTGLEHVDRACTVQNPERVPCGSKQGNGGLELAGAFSYTADRATKDCVQVEEIHPARVLIQYGESLLVEEAYSHDSAKDVVSVTRLEFFLGYRMGCVSLRTHGSNDAMVPEARDERLEPVHNGPGT